MLKRLLCAYTMAAFAFLSYAQANDEQKKDTDPSIENLLFQHQEEQTHPSLACGEKEEGKDEEETKDLACRGCDRDRPDTNSEGALAKCKRCREKRRIILKPAPSASVMSCHEREDEEREVVKEMLACQKEEVKDLVACKKCE